ncbi:hypothetical protein [Sphingomonas sp. EC-HK361]|uniref:hypothetical protein n=1 Tax=Sphingomonas sp. EC-HK361 TaxID=2038397 RepID=UPI001F34BFDD|nr:hypothetical protein [Sphingomonas sp. EC-HK361]
MKNRLFIALPIAGLLCASAPAGASSEASAGWLVRVQVPVLCQLHHQPALVPAAGGAYGLGELQEYCNAPGGYLLSVNYAPGTMRGATISVGEERVVLDGSGTALVSHAPGPRIRERPVTATPGANGFDTDRLNFDIVPE